MQHDTHLPLGDTFPGGSRSGLESTVHSDHQPHAPVAAAPVPERVGRYLVIEGIGSGAMGTVYAAYDPQLDRKVAIKVLREERSADDDFRARMLREAQALARLSDPHVVAVYDAGTFGDRLFIAMDFIRGGTLRQWLAVRRPWREVVDMFLQAGRGLAAAHAVGLVHRDFKPDNVLVGDDGRARVVDFGLAVQGEASAARSRTGALTTSGERWRMEQGALTHFGAIVGTPAYMAPEQLMGSPARAASDQFSFCVALYEGLYGERPFHGESFDALADAILKQRLTEPSRGKRVPVRVRRALLRGLAARPEARHADMASLLAALESAAARPWRRWVALAVAVLAVIAAIVARGWIRDQEDQLARLAAIAAARSEACAGADAQLAGFWDDDRARAVTRAFASTGLAFADHDATQAIAHLGRYAADWTSAHRDLCLAHQRGELSVNLYDRGLACLYERRAALGGIAETLAEADRGIVERSAEAVANLPRHAACTDPAQLLGDTGAADTPELRQRRDPLLQELAQLRARFDLRGDDASARRLTQLLEAARELGDPALQARALELRARVEIAAGARPTALRTLQESWWIALAGRADFDAAHAAEALAYYLADKARVDEAELWVRNGRALLARSPAPDRDLAEALDECDAVIALRRGQPAAGIALLQTIRARVAREEGEANPHYVRLLVNTAAMREQMGDYRGALAELREALRLREALHGADHPLLMQPLESLGIVLDNLGEFAEAQAHYRRALDLASRFHAGDPLRAAYLRNNIGESLYRDGKYADALREFTAAREVVGAPEFAGDPAVGITEVGQANALLRLGRADEARLAYVAAATSLRGIPEGNPMHAYPRVGLAQIALLRGNNGEATRLLDEADALRRPDNASPAERAEVAFLQAQVLSRSPASRARARERAEQALALYVEAGPGFPGPRAEIEAWLAAHPAP